MVNWKVTTWVVLHYSNNFFLKSVRLWKTERTLLQHCSYPHSNYYFCVILTINADYFPQLHSPICVYNRHCVLCGRKWITNYYSSESETSNVYGYLCKVFKLLTVGEEAILEHFLYLTHRVMIYFLIAVKHVTETARAPFCKKWPGFPPEDTYVLHVRRSNSAALLTWNFMCRISQS